MIARFKFYYQLFKKLYHNGRFSKNKTGHKILSKEEKQILKALNTSGIFIVENFLTPDLCNSMRQKLDDTINAKPSAFFNDVALLVTEKKENKFGIVDEELNVKFWADPNISDIRILKSEKLSGEFNELFVNERVNTIGNIIARKELGPNFQMANRVTFVENNLGSGGGWHRDNNYAHGFKILVYLDDVNPSNGPFEYIPASHLLRNHFAYTQKIDQYQFTNEEVEQLIKKYNLETVVVTAKKGSAVFFNTNGIHRGRPIENGTRYAVTNYYH